MNRNLKYAIYGIIGVTCVAAKPIIINYTFANDSSRDYQAEADRQRREAMRSVGGGGVCCSSQGYTFYALWRYTEIAWKPDVVYNLARDISAILGFNRPTQRGSYTDGGPVMGTGVRELRGPGGTIGPI